MSVPRDEYQSETKPLLDYFKTESGSKKFITVIYYFS